MQSSGPSSQLQVSLTGKHGAFTLDAAFSAPMTGVTALFGPSGSGKTSILRCIAGLSRLRGSISVAGDIWQDDQRGIFRKPHQRSIGYVFQEASLFPHLTVRKNLTYGTKRGTPSSTSLAIAFEEAVDLLKIENLLSRMPAMLSGGERQRVSVARALLSHPEVMLMDEPLSALDRTAKDELLSYFETLAQRLPVPFLYVSHDIAEVTRLARHMVLLSHGNTLGEGPTEAMLSRLDLGPATGRFEAGVLLAGKVSYHDNTYRLTGLSIGDQVIETPGSDLAVGTNVRLRVRARDVAVALRKPQGVSIRNILSGTLTEIRSEEDTAFAETLIDVQGQPLRARLTRKSIADLGLEEGMTVFALIKAVAIDGRAVGVAENASG